MRPFAARHSSLPSFGLLRPPSTKRRFLAWCAVCFVFISLLSLSVRLPNCFQRPLGAFADNEDAASHVLATATAFDRVPRAEHHFLPVFTLGAAHDLWIDDLPTASRMSATGHNFYTSWPPGFFVIAWLIPHAFGAQPSLLSLRALNLGLQYLSAVLLALLCYTVAAKLTSDTERRASAAMIGGLTYLAAPEALRSHLFSYWAEQVFQPILLLQLYLFVRSTSYRTIAALSLLGVVGGLIDWSAYVANAGLAVAFLWRYTQERSGRLLVGAACMLLTDVCGALCLLAWFSTALDLASMFDAQRHRAGVRTGGARDYLDLLKGYLLSFGPFVLLFVPFISWLRRGRLCFERMTQGAASWFGPVLLAVSFPVLENLLLANHAASYSYDRLKALSLAAVILAAATAATGLHRRLLAIAFASSSISIALFFAVYTFYRPPSSPLLQRQKAIGEFIKQTAQDDEIAFLNRQVRGNSIWYADRNIVELNLSGRGGHDSMEAFVSRFVRQRGFARGVVYRVSDEESQVEVTRVSSDGQRLASTVWPLR